jgi:hypothetical protein
MVYPLKVSRTFPKHCRSPSEIAFLRGCPSLWDGPRGHDPASPSLMAKVVGIDEIACRLRSDVSWESMGEYNLLSN